jgi:hypothetical protein
MSASWVGNNQSLWNSLTEVNLLGGQAIRRLANEVPHPVGDGRSHDGNHANVLTALGALGAKGRPMVAVRFPGKRALDALDIAFYQVSAGVLRHRGLSNRLNWTRPGTERQNERHAALRLAEQRRLYADHSRNNRIHLE